MKKSELKSAIVKTVDKLLDLDNELRDQPVLQSNNPEEVRATLDYQLPQKDQSFDQLLADFEAQIVPFLNRNTTTNYAAYITGSGNSIGTIAEFIKAFYNQNGLKWNSSPIANELEQLVIKWISEFIGLPEFNQGMITSGGSMSNLLGIHFALAKKFPSREHDGLYSQKPMTVYCSNQTHSSIERGMVFLGMGRSNIRKIDVDKHFSIDINKLIATIENDLKNGSSPLMLVGNAGTTNTGSFDDLKALAEVAKRFNLWYHVDGAYGLPARSLPEHFDKFEGIEKADSTTINPHKWMYVPFEASCILLKEIPKAINFEPDYLYTEDKTTRQESAEHTIELTKEFRALKIWFTLKYFGAKKLTEYVAHDIALTDYFAELLASNDHILVDPNHPLSILCFRWNDASKSEEANENINRNMLRQIENEGKIFITGTKLYGKTYMRSYFGNPDRTKLDVDHLYEIIVNTAKN